MTDFAAADAVVADGTREAAFRGRLLFNPVSHASLFFPAAGYRTTAALQYGGARAYYWSGTASSASQLSCFYITVNRCSPYSQDRGYSWSIRCVRDE